MKKFICAIISTSVILSSAITVNAVDKTPQFVEYAPQYRILEPFEDGISAVRSGAEYALINPNNKVVTKISGEILGYDNHVTRIFRDDNVIFRNDAGVEFLSIPGIYAKPIRNGMVAVQNDDFEYGLYNDKGEMLLSHQYTNIVYGTGNHIFLRTASGWMEYDIVQKKELANYEKVYSVSDEYIVCSVNDICGVIDFSGKVLVPFQYETIVVNDGTFIAYYRDTTSCYDIKGNALYLWDTGICGNYSEGLYYNNSNGIHTYKNASGTTAIDLSYIDEFQFGEPFYDGIAIIQCSNMKTYIDSSGKLLTEQMWDKAYRFANGYALVMNKVADSKASTFSEQWYIIDESFSIVKTLDYDVYIDSSYLASADFSDGYIRTIDRGTGLMGFIRLDEFNFVGNNDFIRGDYDCDGIVEVDDAIALQRAILGKTEYNEMAQYTCDINGDGRITAIDLALIAAAALGKYQISG